MCTLRWYIADDDECSKNNGGCSDVCENEAGGFSCSCPLGLVLGSDGRTCTGASRHDAVSCVTAAQAGLSASAWAVGVASEF